MAGAVQWTIDQFYSQLQALSSQIDAAAAELDADKQQLGATYAAMQAQNDPYRDAFVAPLIHENTVLRLDYLGPVRDKFNQAVTATSGLLQDAGYTTPGLSGLGILPAVIPAAAIAAVVVALAAVAVVAMLTQNQRARTAALIAGLADPTKSAADKQALADALTQDSKNDRAANPPLFDPSSFVAPLLIIAAIVLAPTLLRTFGPRRALA